MLNLDAHDQALVKSVEAAMDAALAASHAPVAVAKRITVLAVRRRNRGRDAAMRRHPFNGVCEASGHPLDFAHAHLDELEPEKGYTGRLRWVCAKANNSGKHSCGVCK